MLAQHHPIIIGEEGTNIATDPITAESQLINLDHDSIETILSYCPNRGAYELQALKYTCKYYYNLFDGCCYCYQHDQEMDGKLENSDVGLNNINTSGKETIRNENLLKRIGNVYLPRLYFQIFIPNRLRVNSMVDMDVKPEEILPPFMKAMRKIFGKSMNQLSDSEFEVEVELSGANSSLLLDTLEDIVDKTKAVNVSDILSKSNVPKNGKQCKLYHLFGNNENEQDILKKHVTLHDLYTHWCSKHFLVNKRVNPFRLYGRMILHIHFATAYPIGFHSRLCRESSLFISNKVFRPRYMRNIKRDEIEFKHGSITHDYRKIFSMETNFESGQSLYICKILLYLLFRYKIIPRMESSMIDLKEIFEKENLRHIKSLTPAEQRNFMIVRENIIKNYRDRLISGRVKFPPNTQLLTDTKVNGTILPQFLTLASVETMNDKQRLEFLKQFYKHIYYSKLNLSDSIRQALFNKHGIEIKNNIFASSQIDNSISINFESIYFKRESAKVSHHKIIFPTFPTILIENLKEEMDYKMQQITRCGFLDKNYTKHCCFSRACGCCNGCGILACWCATSCCCYRSNPESDIMHETKRIGLPNWIGTAFQYVCCYQHRLFPVLDCTNLWNQCCTLWKGNSEIGYRYSDMYDD
ncbi:predicted protein [Naegleria gruberi]|uniref:Predicted protein n=1 Tax=Naegleria gruberi TaxID=5762 RepID=D2VSU0_NAEGR|nr:uncharacterized protein NAEGRDRAFT_72059 [Naegleria gruberi]EFC40256.1 predicted protein [Naegleria gruberi]|eukprot:XP_002673000.1 predicted protein [Naegleria gruberi strain NEG-M]